MHWTLNISLKPNILYNIKTYSIVSCSPRSHRVTLWVYWQEAYEEVYGDLAPAAPICSLWNSVFFIVLHFIPSDSHTFSLTRRISDSPVPSERTTLGRKVMVIEAQSKKNLLVIFTTKKHNHLQCIFYGSTWHILWHV